MPMENADAMRHVRAQITRRYLDSSRLDVRVSYGTVYITGTVSKLREHPETDLAQEMELISLSLRSRPDIRNVVWEAKVAS